MKILLGPKQFVGGMASGKYLTDGFFYTNTGINPFSTASAYGILRQGLKLTQFGTPSDDIKNIIQHVGDFFGYGDDGYLYDINPLTPELAVLDSGNEATRNGARGLTIYNQAGTDYLFYFHDTDFGRYDLTSTYDNDYGSTVPTGAIALQDAPHPTKVWNGILYFGNGRYVGTLDGTTLNDKALTLPQGYEVKDIDIFNNYVAIAISTSSNSYLNKHKLILWSTINSAQWEYEYDIPDKVTALELNPDGLILFGNAVWLFDGQNFHKIDELYLSTTVEPGGTYFHRGLTFWKDNDVIYSYGKQPDGKKTVQAITDDAGSDGALIPIWQYHNRFLISKSTNKIASYNGDKNGAQATTIFIPLDGPYKVRYIQFSLETLTTNDGISWNLYNENSTLKSDTITYASDGALKLKTTQLNSSEISYFLCLNLDYSSYDSGDLQIKQIVIDCQPTEQSA